MDDRTKTKATRAVLRVGDGRGFVVTANFTFPKRVIITAAHCLPHFPPCQAFSYLEERTYQKLLGPLGGDTTVWAECLFADPIADIAVVGAPDGQVLPEECEKYEELVEAIRPLRIADPPRDGPGLMLSLDQHWLPCRVRSGESRLTTSGAKTVSGMSGSPIITEAGEAIGVVVIGSSREFSEGPHPRLTRCLPAWALPGRPRGP